MITAEQMFKKGGYVLNISHKGVIVYEHPNQSSIYFNSDDKEISVIGTLPKKLLPAINQQVKELGW